MEGQELKIIFKHDLAFLTEEVAMDFGQVEISMSPVTFKAPAFWVVRVRKYRKEENKLFVEVLSYHVGETGFSVNQRQLSDVLMTIEKVTFKSIDTSGLLKTLNGTAPVKILPPKPETVYRPEPPKPIEIATQREPIKAVYNEPFTIAIKDLTFQSGKVVFEKKILQFKKLILFEITNEYIIEEYDSVKNYFANVLKTKKIQVVPSIATVDGVITSISATSVDIDKIDNNFIEEIKIEFIKAARKKEPLSNKEIFTIEEYLQSFANEDASELKLFNDDSEFFESVLKGSETKHYKQLRFLSSKHRHEIIKLRIIHSPFSFVFLLGEHKWFHIVWETLDTQEATYIWTVPNDENIKQPIARTDKIISHIIKNGKSDYISKHEEGFNRIFHDYTDMQNGFRSWKTDIEKIIS